MSFIIACIDNHGGIGLNNDLPWKHTIDGKNDMKLFKDVTNNNAIIMGYNTYKSVGKCLPNRLNIIVSNQHYDELKSKNINGLHVFKSLDEAVLFGKAYEEKTNKKCFICGGSMIYDAYFDICSPKEIYISELDENYKCDSFFPVKKMKQLVPLKVEHLFHKMVIYKY